MKKFKFNLEAVLKERKRVEDMRLREWVVAQNALLRSENDKRQLQDNLSRAIDEGTALASLPTNTIGNFIAVDQFVLGTKTKIQWKEREIERAKKNNDKRKTEYVKASQKTKAISKLKEKRHDEFKEQRRAQELRMLDDVYVMRAQITKAKANDEEDESK